MDILKFCGTWRTYQARVLQNASRYLDDGKIHIVAAPGSGKTTLGIELIGRLKKPALILTPSITIREQWAARIAEAFLREDLVKEDYISQDMKTPKWITIATYQSLHSAMTRYQGSEEETEGIAEEKETEERVFVRKEEVDFSGVDIVASMKAAGIGVLCLDECHHLRSEWWKALEEFKNQLEDVRFISLTATPPYDSTPALWKRYLDMCGEIDEEITIPELVKEGSLCPHQDFVYFNYPTEEEAAEIEKFKARSKAMQEKLLNDQTFLQAIQTHTSLSQTELGEKLRENKDYLTAFLIFLQSHQVALPPHLQRLAACRLLPKMNAAYLEALLAGFLYEDAESFAGQEHYQEELISILKAEGLIEKKKIALTVNASIEKLLMNSKGKCKSIRDIVEFEYQNMGENLRLLLLTDYIRKEHEKSLGNADSEVNALGVLPFFEQLRREHAGKTKLRMGILCGTIVVIPAEAKDALIEAAGDSKRLVFSPVGALEETDYLKVSAVGDAHFLTGAVTAVFTKGWMQVLIGTKSLLGEGWDSPCINSLILASFVGSFMLSNQMRGRAIRIFRDQPEKCSNIWHLVCLKPWEEVSGSGEGEISEDFSLLKRRMDHFLGLHYTEDSIESGIGRLSYIKPPYQQKNVIEINRNMLSLSAQRSVLKKRWERALAHYKKMEIVNETKVKDSCVSNQVYTETVKKTVVSGGISAAFGVAAAVISAPFAAAAAGIAAGVGAVATLARLPKLISAHKPRKRLQAVGEGIYRALNERRLLNERHCRVVAADDTAQEGGAHAVYLAGGSGRDKELFAKSVTEFFSQVDDQRYLLVKKKSSKDFDSFYGVPECFSKKKEDAQFFAECMKPYIGEYQLVYTRNDIGKDVLLEGRLHSVGEQEARSISCQKVTEANR